jgi:hypothetical protein
MILGEELERGRSLVADLAATLRDPRMEARAAEALGDVSVEDFVHDVEDLVETYERVQRSRESVHELDAALRSRSAAVRRRAAWRAEQQEAQDTEDAAWVRAKGAVLRARLRPEQQIAAWRVADQRPVVEAGLVRLAHRLTRRCARCEAVAAWLAWLAALGEGLLSAVGWRSLMPAWAPESGRAPPGGPAIVQCIVQRK